MPRRYLLLYVTAAVVLAVAPAGVAAGLWLALSAGWGVAAGSAAYVGVALLVLLGDVLPDVPAVREVER